MTIAEPARILLVDDDPGIVTVVSRLLTTEGYGVVTAGDGQQALARVLQDKPDLMVLDIELPRMNGYQVCQRLKSDPATSGLPIILLSTRTHDHDIEAGFAYNADSYVEKPYEESTLLGEIERLLVRRRSHDTRPS